MIRIFSFRLLLLAAAVLLGSPMLCAQIFFSPYKDVTINANWNTGAQQSAVTGTAELVTAAMPTKNSTLTWAFATGTCGSENWAGITPAMEAVNVTNFVNAGKYYIVSTGGQNGVFTCPTTSGFLSFIQTYYSANMLGVDFDIESGQTTAEIDQLIEDAIAAEATYPNMRFSFTIPSLGASTTGSDLSSIGNTVVTEIQRLGLGGNYFINLMVMDYGSTSSNNCVVSGSTCEMGQSAIAAAESLNANYGIPYSHIELTPDIGANDTAGEVFTLADVDTMTAWMKSNNLGGTHFWSFDRDQPSTSGSSTGNGNSDATLAYNNEFTTDLGSTTGPGGVATGSCTAAPSAPAGLTAASTTASGTSLSWNAVAAPSNCSISSYTVYQNGTAIGTTSGTSYTVSGLSASTTYSFTVKATDSYGSSATSSAVSVTTSAASSCTSVPSAPAGLVASGTTASGTSLSWSAVAAPTSCSISGYTVYENGTSIGTTTSTSYVVSGLAASTTYSFTVKATDVAGSSAASAAASVTTSAASSGTVSLSPSTYNFGTTTVGTGTAWVTFTLTNSGSSAVSISNVAISGPFVVWSNCTSSVAANSSCPIYVYFYPTTTGAATGTLTVTDSASNSPQTAALSGTGQ